MRIALCFAGIVGGAKGKGGKGPSDKVLQIGHEHYKRHILDKNDVDVFVHTWSVDNVPDIETLYKPTWMVFEPQIMFDKNPKRNFRKNNHFSRWYSTKRSIELKREYELENNFTYDCVMTTRFDIAFNIDVLFHEFDMNNFYVTYWDKLFDQHNNHVSNKDMYRVDTSQFKHVPIGWPHDDNGLLDLWFFSNSKTMDQFGTLFDKMKDYLKPGGCPNDKSGWISNHQLALYHLKQMKAEDRILFTMHYGVNELEDYSLIRRKYFNSDV